MLLAVYHFATSLSNLTACERDRIYFPVSVPKLFVSMATEAIREVGASCFLSFIVNLRHVGNRP
jgi:hypothetical protein